MAFQLSGFQRNAYQMFTSAKKAAAKLKKKLRKNTRIKAQADELAEKYKRLAEKELASVAVVKKIIKPYSRPTTLEDVFKLPKFEEVDFEAIAQDAKVKREFLQALKILAEQEEEEMALILISASL